MRRWTAAICVGTVLFVGCSQSHKGASERPSAWEDDMRRSSSDRDETNEMVDLGELEAGVDSASALYEFGDAAHFFSVRDSLRASIQQFLDANPSARSEPDLRQILGHLAALDTLDFTPTGGPDQPHGIDSLALSLDEWPEADTTATTDAQQALLTDQEFPKLSNSRIDFWIRYFTGPGKAWFGRALYRMQLHRPVIESVLTEMELPQELICVALIESGFNLKARSSARAVGPWQFIPGTARIYGLRVNWWFDERRDIVAATYAAGNYLKDLYGIWSSWPLALASYNCGEYRVARAVARHKTENFWKLKLPRQTERYVPKFLAALYILRDPAAYGFEVPVVEPIKFDTVEIKHATDVKLIAESAGTSLDVLRDLNPGLLRSATPPKMELSIKVPPGTGVVCEEKLASIPPSKRISWGKHRIRKGEALSSIATKYGTSISALKRLNGIKNAHRIREGRYLIVPAPLSSAQVASSKPQYKDTRRTINKKALAAYAKKYEPPANHKRTVYRVKDGDTLGEIAESYKTSARKIRRWNNLSYRSYIYPGQKLTIYVKDSFKVAGKSSGRTPDERSHTRHRYKIKRGDTIYSISKQFRVNMSDVLAWNGKSSRSKIYPGQTLEIWTKN